MRSHLRVTLVALIVASSALPLDAQVTRKWTDVNPNRSTLDATDPDGASGGRVNGLGQSATGAVLYAASEMGGLYRSTDAGLTWTHIAGHVPMVTWDVEVDPTNANRVYATSWYDGRVNSRAGINVSTDAGVTWARPATAVPPANFCLDQDRLDNPSAFGIAIDPANTNRVYVGTNCGLAISTDAGVTWAFVDPTTADGADDIWDVVVHHGGIIDVCGDDGHRRSTNGGATWTAASTLPSGRCSIAVSPDEAYVLITVQGTTIRESDDAGATWPTVITNPSAQGRIPFVATNDRAGRAFDLWFGDVWLNSASCTTPTAPAAGGVARCPVNTWAGPYTRASFTCTTLPHCAHDDAGDILFADNVTVDACPILFSNDGGVYYNLRGTSPDCHTPHFEQPTVSPHALRSYALAGADQAGDAAEDLYVGAQDNGSFGTTTAGAAGPTWTNRDCCDVHSIAAEIARVVYSVCCSAAGATLRVRNPGMAGGGAIGTNAPGGLGGFRYADALARFGANSYVAVTGTGVHITTSASANPTVWTQLGAATSPATPRNVWVGVTGGTPTFYVQTGNANGVTADNIWRFVGTGTGSWTQVNPPGGVGGFGVFTVDPVNPNRLFASHLQANANPAMVRSNDGGVTWTAMPILDQLMTGNGVFRYQNNRGPSVRGGSATPGFTGYAMPSLVGFDSANANIMIAGGRESGVFLSLDNGASWETITDPINPATSGTPHLPRPIAAYFDHEPGLVSILYSSLTAYVATDGRGVWRFTRTSRPVLTTICGAGFRKCIEPTFGRGQLVLRCVLNPDACRFIDPIPKNCLYKFGCPGCTAGLCPNFYHIYLDNFDLRLWDVALYSTRGDPVPHEVVKTNRGVVVSFQPSKELYRDKRIGDYALVFAMKPGGRPGRYVIPTRLEVGREPYSARLMER
jgi:hypothetical protein